MGITLSHRELKLLHPDIWGELSLFFNGQGDFPCLFAVSSFNKGLMSFVVADKFSDLFLNISSSLGEFDIITNSDSGVPEKTYRTIIMVCREHTNHDFNEADFMNELLLYLHGTDAHPWPAEKTKSLEDQDFEFYFGGVQWFPVLLHKNHSVKIRKSPFFMVAFQPGKVFDFNKKNRPCFYENMRQSIHRRIKKTYRDELPFYLSEKSSGKNICQYSGLDKKEVDPSYKYPDLNDD